MPRAIDNFSTALALMGAEADLGRDAHSDLLNALANYNNTVDAYNTAHPNDPQIPHITDTAEIETQVAGMIVIAQADANVLQLACNNLADVYAVLESQITNLES